MWDGSEVMIMNDNDNNDKNDNNDDNKI